MIGSRLAGLHSVAVCQDLQVIGWLNTIYHRKLTASVAAAVPAVLLSHNNKNNNNNKVLCLPPVDK